jgi:hypothetical protein
MSFVKLCSIWNFCVVTDSIILPILLCFKHVYESVGYICIPDEFINLRAM